MYYYIHIMYINESLRKYEVDSESFLVDNAALILL